MSFSEISIDCENIYEVGVPMSFAQFELANEGLENIEYIDGMMYFKPECTSYHDYIKNAIGEQLLFHLISIGSNCKVLIESLNKNKKALGIMQRSIKPDIMIACDYTDIFNDYEGIPKLIIEVLSKSNSNHDLKTKLKLYKSMGVEEYIILDSRVNSFEDATILQYTADGHYLNIYKKDEKKLKLESFDLTLNLNELYK